MKEEKFYLVDAKCGHVGRNNYIIKTFAVKAKNGKQAAKFTRHIPRVKHHMKSAIVSTQKVDEQTYVNQLFKNKYDPYLKSESRQEQNRQCEDLYNDVKAIEEDIEPRRNKRESVRYRLRKYELQKESYGGIQYANLQTI